MAEHFDRAAEHGLAIAEEIIAANEGVAEATPPPFGGYLILEGDSWFDYPVFKDIAEVLKKDYSYSVKSAAHFGHTAEAMAYIPKQLSEVSDLFKELADDKKKARAILLSSGGNTVVDYFGALLNHKLSGVAALNASVLQGILREEVPRVLISLASSLVKFSEHYFKERRPILIHGYAGPVPDGRSYPILGLSGPWLMPVFARKGYVSDPQTTQELAANTAVMAEAIRIFNEDTLAIVATEINKKFPGVLVPVDLRKAFSNDLSNGAYRTTWRDEQHGTSQGFENAAAVFDQAIQKIPMP